jgi:DNA-binding transcriptional MerR regulator
VGTYTIGKLAEAAGVHVETVRYYERRGLLAEPPRTAAGYRQYSADDLWRLRFIGRGKALGFTLAEVAEVLGPGGPESGRSAERVLAAARAKITAVEEQERALARTRGRLEQLADLCAHGEAGCLTLQVDAQPA